MESRHCRSEGCSGSSGMFYGRCRACCKPYWFDHLHNKSAHPCAKSVDAQMHNSYVRDRGLTKSLLKRIDFDSAVAQASALRHGVPCQVTADLTEGYPYKQLKHGGCNMHIPIQFDDGHQWMIRIRYNRLFHPAEAMRMNIVSEIATMKALREGGMRVPEAWLPDQSEEYKAANIHWFFIDHITGSPEPTFLTGRPPPPTDPILRIIHNMALSYLDLEKTTFTSIGSPTMGPDGKVIVGPIIDRFPMYTSEPYYAGPFKTPRERYVDHFQRRMDYILAGVWCEKKAKVQLYLQCLEVKTLVEECEELSNASGPYYIKHGEPKGDQILVDDEGNITGTIDWEWSYISSKEDAFSAPEGLANQRGCRGLSLSRFETAFAEAYITLGRPDLAQLVRSGKKYQMLEHATIGDVIRGEQMVAMRNAFKSLSPDESEEVISTADWVKAARERYRGDPGLESLMEERQQRLPTSMRDGDWYGFTKDASF